MNPASWLIINVPIGPPEKWAPTKRVFSELGAHFVHAPCIAGKQGAFKSKCDKSKLVIHSVYDNGTSVPNLVTNVSI